MLLGRSEWDTRALLRELHGQRLAASVIVDSPEFCGALRLHHLTGAGVMAVADRLDMSPAALVDVVPVERAELLARLARVETAVGIADTVAMLADDLRHPGGDESDAAITLYDASSTCWAPHCGRAVATPPRVEAWARLRAGSLCATVLLAWDRAGAPRVHRRARVAAWYRANDDWDAPWGATLPPLLVVCPDEGTVAQWNALLDGSATRRGRGLLRSACTTVPELTCRGPLDRIWRRPGDGVRISLLDFLAWEGAASVRARPAAHAPCRPPRRRVQSAVGGAAGGPRSAMQAVRAVASIDQRTTAEQRAALAISPRATQKTLLGWVAQHPLLPAGHLATYLSLPVAAVITLLDGLMRFGLVCVDATPGFGDGAGPRYVLTRCGTDLLAARQCAAAHVSPRGNHGRRGESGRDTTWSQVGGGERQRPPHGSATPA